MKLLLNAMQLEVNVAIFFTKELLGPLSRKICSMPLLYYTFKVIM